MSNWYWFAASLLIAYLCAVYYFRYTNPVYQVSGTVLINSDKKVSTSEEAILSELGYSNQSEVMDEVQYLKSSYLMRRVVDSLDLHISYQQFGRIRVNEQFKPFVFKLLAPELNQEVFGRRLRMRMLDAFRYEIIDSDERRLPAHFGDTITHQGLSFVIWPGMGYVNDMEYEVSISNPKQVARNFARGLGVQLVERSNVIQLSITDPAPERAISLLRTLVQEYNATVLEEKKLAGNNTLDFIDERLKYIAQELYDVERDAESYRRDNDLPVGVSAQAETYLEKVGDLDKQLLELEVQKGLLNNLEGYLKNTDKAFPDASNLIAPSLSPLIRQYNELLFKRENMLDAATNRNPAVSSFEEQLANLRSNLQTSINNLQRELDKQKQTLEQHLSPIERRINAVPRNERELLQIMRQQKIKETLFLFLLQKREETALNIAAQTSDAFILDEPENNGPVSPGRSRILLLALLAGLGIPLGILFLLDQLDDRIRSRKDLERITDIPFLGVIAYSKGDSPVVVEKDSRTAVAEMFRLLRTNLQFNAAGTPNQVMLITSSMSGEGKSFTTLNLAISQALLGKKTVVIGLDLRKPKVVQYLTGRRLEPGLTNYLLGNATLEELVHAVPGYDGLFCIDSGPIPPNPSELLQQERLASLFIWLRNHYESVIVDSAPVGLVTDALLLGPYIDHTLLVTRYGVTSEDAIRMLDELYHSGKLVRPGIILNGISARAGYGRGFKYGYGYGYGYYETPKRRRP